jgi:AAHS family 4-hydroxybenzoate transporter-like MFS transporter
LSEVIHVEQLVDEQKIRFFNIWLLIWSFLAMFSDGYDIQAVPFAAPELIKDWGITKGALTAVLTASNIGVLVGAPLMGWIGDRFGRKVAIIAGSVLYGLTTLAMLATHSLDQMFWLRLITGVGLGGLMANTIALNSELAPKRWRATLVVLMFIGITFGSGTPGPVAAWLMPTYGWHVIFLIGGLAPLAVAAGLVFALPESIKFLAMMPHRNRELLKLARRMRPDLTISDDARFVSAAAVDHDSANPVASPVANPSGLFKGGLALITPLIWLCFCTVLMSNYFLNSWMPLLFQDSGLSVKQAALTTSLYHLGASIGGILIAVLLDRFGFIAIAVMCAISVPFVAMMGQPGISPELLAVASTIAGFGILGAQFGNNASAGLIYPTGIRSTGLGWAFGVGRFGSILGPTVGGWLIARHVPTPELFKAAAVPMLVCVIAAFILTRLCYVRYGRLRLDDVPVSDAQHPAGTLGNTPASR